MRAYGNAAREAQAPFCYPRLYQRETVLEAEGSSDSPFVVNVDPCVTIGVRQNASVFHGLVRIVVGAADMANFWQPMLTRQDAGPG
jgi:hypothetical protein